MLNGSQSLSLYNGFDGNFCLVHGISSGMWHIGTTFACEKNWGRVAWNSHLLRFPLSFPLKLCNSAYDENA